MKENENDQLLWISFNWIVEIRTFVNNNFIAFTNKCMFIILWNQENGNESHKMIEIPNK